MSFKSWIIQKYALRVKAATEHMAKNAIQDQNNIFNDLIKKASRTQFGQDHDFKNISNHSTFLEHVPIRNYEDLKPYIEKILLGKENILWPGKPKYLAKTSGTTSGVKYIPISNASIKYHISTARNAILNYVAQTKKNVFGGKMIFLSGSPVLDYKSNIATGRLSGIVNHEIPQWVKPNQLPTYETNCIAEWESKLKAIVKETFDQDMTLISGIPPWVQMYFEQILAQSGKSTIKGVFPNLNLFIHGGVNYQPYKLGIDKLIGQHVDTLETYPASEGFIAYQNDVNDDSLLLNTKAGMFFEFVDASEIFAEAPKRLTLEDVKLNKDYVILISSNAGLWAYNIGDTIRFTSKAPFKIKVSGRIKHFISAFGEHVIAKEVEEAIQNISNEMNLNLTEFTVAPEVNPEEGQLPYHEWFIEFENVPENLDLIEIKLNEEILRQNIYYRDLIEGSILQTLKITTLQKGAFRNYMKSKGKLGGQNKVPRLTNDRIIADALKTYKI